MCNFCRNSMAVTGTKEYQNQPLKSQKPKNITIFIFNQLDQFKYFISMQKIILNYCLVLKKEVL